MPSNQLSPAKHMATWLDSLYSWSTKVTALIERVVNAGGDRIVHHNPSAHSRTDVCTAATWSCKRWRILYVFRVLHFDADCVTKCILLQVVDLGRCLTAQINEVVELGRYLTTQLIRRPPFQQTSADMSRQHAHRHVIRSYPQEYRRSHQNSQLKPAWAGLVLG